jgi:hypothetical protein
VKGEPGQIQFTIIIEKPFIRRFQIEMFGIVSRDVSEAEKESSTSMGGLRDFRFFRSQQGEWTERFVQLCTIDDTRLRIINTTKGMVCKVFLVLSTLIVIKLSMKLRLQSAT